ncbi:MAG: hypothetical protein NVS1B11_06140 [Terriglobales bacterium]
MPFDTKASNRIFKKLERQIVKLNKDSSAPNIHGFRTSSRRVEAVLQELCPDSDRNTRKLLKLLAGLRKKAGKVRDLEVQVAALKNLKIAREGGHKAQLIRNMTAEHAKRNKKFAKAFDDKTRRQMHKRLKRAAADFEAPVNLEPANVALRGFGLLGRTHAPLTQATLHRYRIVGKKARYIAELATQDDGAARRVVDELKRMQDVIGDWHDWLQLSEKAAEMFGGAQDSPLVSALRNITRAKFRHSLTVLGEIRQKLLADKQSAAINPPSNRKPPSQDYTAVSAVA